MKKTKRTRVTVPKQKLTEYEEFKKDEPEMPDFTCPHIDNVVDWLYKAEKKWNY